MNYLSINSQENFLHAFAKQNMNLKIKTNYMVVEDGSTKEKIEEIVESIGFCPLICEKKIKGNFAFTITPYKIPKSFKENIYFTKDELLKLLEQQRFTPVDGLEVKDRWGGVNTFRRPVACALNNGLSEIISEYARPNYPVVEIGSGIGYTFTENLSLKIIRTQACWEECQLLSKTITNPVHYLNIDKMHLSLLESGKKISLFFALDVFDTMPSSLRKKSFLQLSELQNSDDRILVMLDTNPHLNTIVEHLESLYPEHAIFPYCSLTNSPSKISVILVPIEYIDDYKPSLNDLVQIINAESTIEGISSMQRDLHKLQKEHNLKVIILEDFFAEQISCELKEAGYESDIYYAGSFVTGNLPKEALLEVKEDLVYKPVADKGNVRQWSLTNPNLLENLSKKGLELPAHFNQKFLTSMREKGQRIFGAEILVINARKI